MLFIKIFLIIIYKFLFKFLSVVCMGFLANTPVYKLSLRELFSKKITELTAMYSSDIDVKTSWREGDGWNSGYSLFQP